MNITSAKSVELSRTLIAYRNFEENDMTYFEFDNPSTPDLVAGLKKDLKSHIDKLGQEQKDLEAMVHKCGVRARMVSHGRNVTATSLLANALP